MVFQISKKSKWLNVWELSWVLHLNGSMRNSRLLLSTCAKECRAKVFWKRLYSGLGAHPEPMASILFLLQMIIQSFGNDLEQQFAFFLVEFSSEPNSFPHIIKFKTLTASDPGRIFPCSLQ